MIMACKPFIVQSKRTVADGSSMPCPIYVFISGYRCANSGAMIGDSKMEKCSTVPSANGNDTITSDFFPCCSMGASKRMFFNSTLSTDTVRYCLGIAFRLPPSIFASALSFHIIFSFCEKATVLIAAENKKVK